MDDIYICGDATLHVPDDGCECAEYLTKLAEVQEQLESITERVVVLEQTDITFNELLAHLEDRMDTADTWLSDRITLIEDSDYYQNIKIEELSQSMASAYKYVGSVETTDDLPSDAEQGDVYNVIENGVNYAWTGEEWDALGGVYNVQYELVDEYDEETETLTLSIRQVSPDSDGDGWADGDDGGGTDDNDENNSDGGADSDNNGADNDTDNEEVNG